MELTPFKFGYFVLYLCILVSICSIDYSYGSREGYSPVQNFSDYENSTSLHHGFTVYWSGDEEWIHLAFEVETLGWIGFGIAENTSGSMPGADILVAWVDDQTGEVVVQDRWAHAKATPQLDRCSNWLSDGGFQNDTHTVIGVTRRRFTGDFSDRDIPNGFVKVIWAHSSDNSDSFSYHGPNRHAASIKFFPEPSEDYLYEIDPSWKSIDLLMKNYTVPNEETIYACQSFDLTMPDTDHHIVRIEPLLDPATSSMVHHFLLHQCQSNGAYPNFLEPKKCTSPVAPTADSNCISPIFGWGVGGTALKLPLEAGYRLGTATSNAGGMRYFILEVHYNSPNPSLPVFRTDQSGVRVWYTENLREHDAGMMVLGDPFVTSVSIPPGGKTHVQATCQGSCTQQWTHPIYVFADFLHMHSIGYRMWSTVHRNGVQLPAFLNRIEFYDYNFQDLGPIIPPYKLMPGDTIQTHCIFNSATREANTAFGPESSDEMCMDFIAYYPILKDTRNDMSFAVCGYANTGKLPNVPSFITGNLTACGALDQDDLIDFALSLNYANVVDRPGDEKARFGTQTQEGYCPDPYTGKFVQLPSTPSKPSSVDSMVIIWASVGGVLILGVIGLAIFTHFNKNARKPQKLKPTITDADL